MDQMTSQWMSEEYRIKVLADIGTWENRRRKLSSLKQYEIHNDRAERFVFEHIAHQMGYETAKSMPLISCVNLSKAIVKNEASIYKMDPERNFLNVSDSDAKALTAIYDDGRFNEKFKRANAYYKLQNQTWLQIVPKNGRLEMRLLLPHHIDVIPSDDDPEEAQSYIVSSFDKTLLVRSDGSNEVIADTDDYRKSLEKYVVWDKDVNFIMNGHGEIVGDVTPNMLGGLMPFVDIASEKDYEYFVRQGQTLTDFTIQYNAALTDLQHIVRLQGFSVMVFKAPTDTVPSSLKIGPNTCIHIPVDPNNAGATGDFSFASPSPDISGAIAQLEGLLANFLSSHGNDTSVISNDLQKKQAFNSGIERMLAMIERFEASRDDLAIFSWAEDRVLEIVTAYLAYYSNSDELDGEYHASSSIQDANLNIQFAKPEVLKTDTDKVAYASARKALGTWSDLDMIMYLEDLEYDDAVQRLTDIEEDNKMVTDIRAKFAPEVNQALMNPEATPKVNAQAPLPLENTAIPGQPVKNQPALGAANGQAQEPKAIAG